VVAIKAVLGVSYHRHPRLKETDEHDRDSPGQEGREVRKKGVASWGLATFMGGGSHPENEGTG